MRDDPSKRGSSAAQLRQMAEQYRLAATDQPGNAASLLRRAERYEMLAAIQAGIEAFWGAPWTDC